MSEQEILMVIKGILRNAQMSDTFKKMTHEYRELTAEEFDDLFQDTCKWVEVCHKIYTIIDGYLMMKSELVKQSTKRLWIRFWIMICMIVMQFLSMVMSLSVLILLKNLLYVKLFH